jgi:hypothetical protein
VRKKNYRKNTHFGAFHLITAFQSVQLDPRACDGGKKCVILFFASTQMTIVGEKTNCDNCTTLPANRVRIQRRQRRKNKLLHPNED